MKSTCTSCGKVFKSVSGFDKHWTGKLEKLLYQGSRVVGRIASTRRCRTADEMSLEGFTTNAKGWWILGTSEYEFGHKNEASIYSEENLEEAAV